IEDSGVSFSDEARGKMEELLRQAAAGTDLQVLGEAPRLGISVVGRLSKMYDMAIALRQSAYGGVRAVVVVPSNMLTKDPAASLAHGIGANSTATMDTDGVEGPNRKPKKRRPTTGPRLPEQDDGSRDDDAPLVTEWTPNGLPQRRSRVKIPLRERYAEAARIAAEEEAAAAAAAAAPSWGTAPAAPKQEQEKKEKEKPPGHWVEGFWEGLKRDPDPNAFTSKNQPAAEADDEGDLK
ncbi:ATP-binding protein, partial [Streptomyces sp. NPDC057927]